MKGTEALLAELGAAKNRTYRLYYAGRLGAGKDITELVTKLTGLILQAEEVTREVQKYEVGKELTEHD
jgi:hypothetical protein